MQNVMVSSVINRDHIAAIAPYLESISRLRLATRTKPKISTAGRERCLLVAVNLVAMQFRSAKSNGHGLIIAM